MDQILLGLGAAGAALLLIAIAVALWEHRRHLAEMRQQLAWSENRRDLLQTHANDVDARLATLSAAVNAQQSTAPAARLAAPPNGPAETPVPHYTTAHAGSAAVAMAAAQAALTQHWIDTEPMVLTSQVMEGAAPNRALPDTQGLQGIQGMPDWDDWHDRHDVPDFDPTMPVELSAY